MPAPDRQAIAFVRALLGAPGASRDASGVFITTDERKARLDAERVRQLVSAGVLAGDAKSCRALPEARNWLKRQLLDADAHTAQHRLEIRTPDGTLHNLGESPLTRLAAPAHGGAAFLSRHQLEAGERVRRLVERARLQHRVTMSYSFALTASAAGPRGGAAEITDMAVEARRQLGKIHDLLPPDCAGAVLDVCGFLKGLQQVEAERGWPRRSAKLVLRIGLEQLAQYFGLAPAAIGPELRRRHAWMDEGGRPEVWE